MSYQIRNPKDIKEISKVFSMLKRCFPKINEEYFIKRILGDPYYNKRYTYLLIKDGSFISHVQLFKKKIYYYGKQLLIIGLGAICTLPEYRNKGYSKKLLKKVIQNIEDRGFPLIILFTRIPAFYERLKFSRTIRNYYLLARRKRNAQENLKNESLRIRQFDFVKDILSIIEIYESFFKSSFGPAAREFKDWQLQLSYFNEDKKLFLVLEDNQGIMAYIRSKRHTEDNRKIIEIVEFASKDRDNSFLVYLLSYIFKVTNADYLRIDSKLTKEDDLAKFFVVKTVNNSLLMFRLNKNSKTINKGEMKEIVLLESDAF